MSQHHNRIRPYRNYIDRKYNLLDCKNQKGAANEGNFSLFVLK